MGASAGEPGSEVADVGEGEVEGSTTLNMNQKWLKLPPMTKRWNSSCRLEHPGPEHGPFEQVHNRPDAVEHAAQQDGLERPVRHPFGDLAVKYDRHPSHSEIEQCGDPGRQDAAGEVHESARGGREPDEHQAGPPPSPAQQVPDNGRISAGDERDDADVVENVENEQAIPAHSHGVEHRAGGVADAEAEAEDQQAKLLERLPPLPFQRIKVPGTASMRPRPWLQALMGSRRSRKSIQPPPFGWSDDQLEHLEVGPAGGSRKCIGRASAAGRNHFGYHQSSARPPPWLDEVLSRTGAAIGLCRKFACNN